MRTFFFVFFLVVFHLVFRGTWVSNLSPGLKLANRRDFTAEAKKVFRRLIIGKDNSESNFFHFKLFVFATRKSEAFRRLMRERYKMSITCFQISSLLHSLRGADMEEYSLFSFSKLKLRKWKRVDNLRFCF